MRLLLLAVLVAAPALAQPDLGTTTFANSGAAEAQEPFLRGLLLLHSFEYDDAREAFQEAQAVDPSFVMAYWGEAMTHNHPVWQRQDRDAARAALARLDAQTGVEMTPRERAYLNTLGVLLGEGEKDDRDDDYAVAMEHLAREFPEDHDAQAFYALALLGTAHEGRDFATYMRAAAVAEEVFDANPQHPGAAHYLIHAYDDPVHAPLGLRPARVYADIAPAASHALHMPSHIYLALGLWEDVAAMNERSFAAAKAGTDARGEALNGHGWHALWWWHYAALQLEDMTLADRTLALAGELADGSGTAVSHLTRIAAQHAAATGDGSVLGDGPPASAGVSTLAVDALPRGLIALYAGDVVSARATLIRLEAFVAGDDDAPWHARAAALMLSASLDAHAGDEAGALVKLEEAAALERQAPLMFGPPAPVVQAHEFYGLALLDAGRVCEAAAAFRAALDRAPNRRSVVEALARVQARAAPEAAPAGGSD